MLKMLNFAIICLNMKQSVTGEKKKLKYLD